MYIFDDETTNATSGDISIGSSSMYKMTVWGTMGGATVTMYYSIDGTNFVAVDSGLTAAGGQDFYLPDKCKIHVVISGGSGATISVTLHPIRLSVH